MSDKECAPGDGLIRAVSFGIGTPGEFLRVRLEKPQVV
jgi:hypothetical protein